MLDHFIGLVTDIASRYALLAYLVVGLSALLEAMPVIGALFPGSMLIVALSALASAGTLGTLPLFVAAVMGAVAGDGLSF
ncbi:hypothetical protein [Salinicola halimionae]|uniref:hypothetical protein n=1 Tax=Salinicola halimionae TaxID=1949081 RepID=UPI000DA198BE|nr:hypothetical protein [Salinicola halimionae]